MSYTAKKRQFIVNSILSFIDNSNFTESDIRKIVLSYLNEDKEFFSDEQLELFENKLNSRSSNNDNQ